MKKWSIGTFLASLLTMLCMTGNAIAATDDSLTSSINQACNHNPQNHHKHHKKCLPEKELTAQFRMWEAFQIAQDNAAKVHNALDKVLDSNGPGDPNFETYIDFVIGLQLDPNNMDITIDGNHITNSTQFRAAWAALSQAYAYRKRNITEWIIDETAYVDQNCLRQITAYAIGQNFNILNFVPFGHFTTINSYSNDRFQVVLQEIPPKEGQNCEFNFRIKSVVQITEAIFPLPNGAQVVSSPFGPPNPPLIACPPNPAQ